MPNPAEASIMQQALGAQWERLPEALKRHYQTADNIDVGRLSIAYPRAMQWYLNLLHAFGALLNRRGEALPARVSKRMQDGMQHWQRRIHFPDGREVRFDSRWKHASGNELIEYVNPLLGLRMAVWVEHGRLYYSGRHIVLRLWRLRIPIPEWLALGHTSIEEFALDQERFQMDFRLRHPWFGEIYRYSGIFTTRPSDDDVASG